MHVKDFDNHGLWHYRARYGRTIAADTIRQPINRITNHDARLLKLCQNVFGQGNCGIA